jgi:hypothetical protein
MIAARNGQGAGADGLLGCDVDDQFFMTAFPQVRDRLG